MLPDDLDLLTACARPSLIPDGSLAVSVVSRPDLAEDAYAGAVWLVPTDGSAARRLTNGPRDSAAAVSPDGRRVAFLRAPEDGAPQLHVVRLDGGEPAPLTDAAVHPLGAGAPTWSPDGTRLAYVARVPETGRYGTEDEEGRVPKPDREAPRLVTEPKYRSDDVGFTRDRRRHVFVVDVPMLDGVPGQDLPDLPRTPRQLTDGDQDDLRPTWSPDGGWLAFGSARHAGRETDLRSAVHAVPASGGEVVVLAEDPELDLQVARWLEDRRLVLSGQHLGADGTDFVGKPQRLWVSTGSVEPGADAVPLRTVTGDDLDLDVVSPDDLVPHDGRVLVRDLHRGTVRLLAVDLDGGGHPEVLLSGDVVVGGQAAAGGVVVVNVATPERRADLAVVREQRPRWLTDVSARLRPGVRTLEPHLARSPDGHEVHGWVVLPDPGAFPGPHPVLLTVHGGPFSQYDVAVFDEAQVYAGAGYAVVMCNPRGSRGYGLEHGRSIRSAMGTVDADDVLAFLDSVLDDSSLPLDAQRVGVMGGSYGGYMTATLTTRTDRFAAAVVERGYLDATSFVGSSDIGWFFPGEYHGAAGRPGDAGAEQTPMAHVDQVSTPTLVIHSEHDWRCPVEQGQRWFTALRLRGVEAELLLFPGEGHELSRSGSPRHRRQRFEHLLRWWGRHLPVRDGV